jgi:hypothetical protein
MLANERDWVAFVWHYRLRSAGALVTGAEPKKESADLRGNGSVSSHPKFKVQKLRNKFRNNRA